MTDTKTPDLAASLAEAQAENQALRSRMAYLLDQAERNHAIMMRHQGFDLDIVSAASFQELVGTIFRNLPVISDLDAVTLTLIDEDADIHTVMGKLGVNFAEFPGLLFADSVDALGLNLGERTPDARPPKPQLSMYDPLKHGHAFPNPPQAMQSVALVPLLRNKRIIGSLNIGSVDPTRFTPSMATDFIEHMGSIIAICLENVISNEMLKYIGLTDSLTGIYNRRYMDRRLLEEISRARRQDYDIAFMYIDIDHFKRVNDTIGHQGGDEVLREVANRIKHELRLSDSLARFGGEEFVVLLINANLESAAFVAERIRASIAASMIDVSSSVRISVTASLGVACLNRSVLDTPVEAAAMELIAQADAALYQAKDGGRNRVISFHPAV